MPAQKQAPARGRHGDAKAPARGRHGDANGNGHTNGKTNGDIPDHVRNHHASKIIQASSDAHSQIVAMKTEVDKLQNSKKMQAIKKNLAKHETDLKQAVKEAKKAGVDLQKPGNKAIQQIKAARQTGGFNLSESRGTSPQNHVANLVDHGIREHHGEYFAPEDKHQHKHRFMDFNPTGKQLTGKKKKAAWRKHQRAVADQEKHDEEQQKKRDQMVHELYHAPIPEPTKKAGYTAYKEPHNLKKDDFGNRYEKLLKSYQKDDFSASPAPTKKTKRVYARPSNLLFTMSGGNFGNTPNDADIGSQERTVYTYDSMVYDEIKNMSGNLRDALFEDYDVDCTSHRESPHDKLMRNMHRTKEAHKEFSTKRTRKAVNKCIMEGETKLVRRDFNLVQKYRAKTRHHRHDTKMEALGNDCENIMEQSTAIPQPSDFDVYRPTEFLMNAPGLYEARDITGKWHKCVVTESQGAGYHLVSVPKKQFTLTNQIVNQSSLRVAAFKDVKNMFEAKDAEGQFWDVIVKGRKGGTNLAIDVMQDGKVIKKDVQMPQTALRHKLLTGMSGLYQGLDSNGNWFNINVHGKADTKKGDWYKVDALHPVLDYIEIVEDMKVPRHNIRLRPGARFRSTKKGALRGFPNLMPREMEFYNHLGKLVNVSGANYKAGEDLSPNKKAIVILKNAHFLASNAEFESYTPAARTKNDKKTFSTKPPARGSTEAPITQPPSPKSVAKPGQTIWKAAKINPVPIDRAAFETPKPEKMTPFSPRSSQKAKMSPSAGNANSRSNSPKGKSRTQQPGKATRNTNTTAKNRPATGSNAQATHATNRSRNIISGSSGRIR